MNARPGRWLDRSTRHDGIQVDCRLQKLETKRFVNANPDEMREGWENRKQRAWNAACCNDEAWREAIDNGWIIVSTLTFRMGETVSFAAKCGNVTRPKPALNEAFDNALSTSVLLSWFIRTHTRRAT
jgi:hypothetical protein